MKHQMSPVLSVMHTISGNPVNGSPKFLYHVKHGT